MTGSPYQGTSSSEWLGVTGGLLREFPLTQDQLVNLVLRSWEQIYESSFGSGKLRVGSDIFLPAQATGVILEKLIAVDLGRQGDFWRGGAAKHEKDIVCVSDLRYSFEVKTSSTPKGVYGNRSTGHRGQSRRKIRTGFYLVINYKLPKPDDLERFVRLIRFGWIDDDDWVGQAKPTGQQASVSREVLLGKLVTLFQR